MKRIAMGRTETAALEWIARLVSVPALIVAVAVPVNQLTQPGAAVEVRLGRPMPPDPAPGVSYLASSGSHLVELDVATGVPWWLRLGSESGFALSWLAIGLGAFMLARVLKAVAWGDPFDRRNPTRLMVLAACVLVGGTLAPLVQALASTAVVAHVGLTDELRTPVPFPLVPFLLAGLVAVVAGAFQRGRQLTAETEGLI